jgi:hypothetical protein
MVRFLGMKDSADLSLKMRIATETGERLLAYAFEQPSAQERTRVVDELKELLAGYLFK